MKTSQNQSKSSLTRVLSLRNFRLLFAGSTTSLLGDQFTLIATPWLVLQLTGDPLALGIVLALEGIPRAVFMLLGGAITDRISQRTVMIIADVIRFLLTALMAGLVLFGAIKMWMLYTFALSFGLVAGFAIPAQNSIVPMLVEERDLEAGNSIMMGITQLVGFLGPTIAGILIGKFSDSLLGIGLAFGIDAFTFTVSAMSLWLMKLQIALKNILNTAGKENVWQSIGVGIGYLWNDKVLRLMFLVLAAVNFLLMGPLMVGIPVLADVRLPEGAIAYGLLMSAFAGGNLIGFFMAGSLPHPNAGGMKAIVLVLIAAFGLVIAALGFIPNTWVDFGLLFLLGLGNGYIAIILFTWMQKRTPKDMLGRMMSLIMLSNTGLTPISQAIAGVVSKIDLTLLFVSAGLLVLLVVFVAAFQPELGAFAEGVVGTDISAN